MIKPSMWMVMKMIEPIIFEWAIVGILSTIGGALVIEFKRQQALKEGVCALLRDRIIQTAKNYKRKKHAPVYARENMDSLHEAYDMLGGNGAITDIYNDFRRLPVWEEDDDELDD